jgi:hypothetical protein
MRSKFFLTILLIAAAVNAWAGETADAGRTVSVLGQVGRATEIMFEDGVVNLVRSGDPATLKVEHVSGRLFVTPLTKDPAELTVIDTRGRSVRIGLVFDRGYDERIVIDGGAQAAETRDEQGAAFSLMKAMVLGRVLQGASESRMDKVVFDNGSLRFHLKTVYELPGFRGYRGEVRNLRDHAVLVPLQEVMWPGLVAVSSEKDILSRWGAEDKGDVSTIYMVVAR